MIYSNTQPSFHLQSSWQCDWDALGYGVEWYISSPPTTDTRTIIFAVDLPFDAVVKRCWLTMEVGSPLTGAAVKKVNGISIPSDGVVELATDSVSASATSFEAVFTFKANGRVYEDTDIHTASLPIETPTLNVEYYSTSDPDEEPETKIELTVDNEGYATLTGPALLVDSEGNAELRNAVLIVDALGNATISGGDVVVTTPESEGLQLPRLLGEDFREVARLEPYSLRLELNIDPKSTAIMRLTHDQHTVKIGDFLELFSPHGSAGVFRVVEIDTTYGPAALHTVYMEHAIATLEDSLAIGAQTMSAPVATVFATLLETQNVRHWVMGDCDVPEDYELIYEYSYENLLAAVTKLTAELPAEYMWQFDTTRHPFVMHLRKLPEDECEGRLSRNLASATVNVDRSKMCTRLIPFGAGEQQDRVSLTSLTGSQHMDSPNAEVWGLKSNTWTAEDIYDALTLRDVAERYLKKYGQPLVSISMDALDLSAATGESIDRFALGALCRMALPDYGISMQERVIALTWGDVYNRPEEVDVSLANRVRDASDEIADLLRQATSSKLLGGKVETVEETGYYGSISPGAPYAQYFEVTGYGNLVNVRTTYKCTTSAGADVSCTLIVDGNTVDAKDAVTRTVDVTRYLQADENGVPLVGEHRVIYQPKTANNVTSSITATLSLKQIKKG